LEVQRKGVGLLEVEAARLRSSVHLPLNDEGLVGIYSVAMATTPLNDHCKNSQLHQFRAEQALINVSTSYFISSSSFMKQKIHTKISRVQDTLRIPSERASQTSHRQIYGNWLLPLNVITGT
jgi:hypothetical protein